MSGTGTAVQIQLERDEHGHFVRGNQAAAGRKRDEIQQRAYELRKAMLEVAGPEEAKDVMRAVIAEAKAGNMLAAALFFDRTIGKVKPVEADSEDGHRLRDALLARWDEWARPADATTTEQPPDAA